MVYDISFKTANRIVLGNEDGNGNGDDRTVTELISA